MANKKYELMKDDTIKAGGKTLYRIKALRDIGNYVDEGDEGGYIESEKNLSQKGECWVRGDDSIVYGNAVISGDILIEFENTISGNVKISGDNESEITGCTISGNAVIEGHCEIKYSNIYGKAYIKDSNILKDSEVYGNAVIKNSQISGTTVKDNAVIEKNSITYAKHGGGRVNRLIFGKNTHVSQAYIAGMGEFLFPNKSDVISPKTVDPKLFDISAEWNIYESKVAITSSKQFEELAHSVSGWFEWPKDKKKKKLKQSMLSQAKEPKKFSSPAEEFKYWVKELIDQCNDDGANGLRIRSGSGNTIEIYGNYSGCIDCEFKISGNQITSTFKAEFSEYDDGFWNIGEEHEYDEVTETNYAILEGDTVRINKKHESPMKKAAADFLILSLSNEYIAYGDKAEKYMEMLEELVPED